MLNAGKALKTSGCKGSFRRKRGEGMMIGNKELLCAGAKMAAPVIVSVTMKGNDSCKDSNKIRDVDMPANADSGIMPMAVNPLPDSYEAQISISPALTRNVRIVVDHKVNWLNATCGDYRCVNGRLTFCCMGYDKFGFSVAWLDDAGNLASDFSAEKII